MEKNKRLFSDGKKGRKRKGSRLRQSMGFLLAAALVFNTLPASGLAVSASVTAFAEDVVSRWAMNEEELANAFAEASSGKNVSVTLGAGINVNSPLTLSGGSLTLELGNYQLSSSNNSSDGIVTVTGGTFTLKGSKGTIKSTGSVRGILVSGGKAIIDGGTVSGESSYAVGISGGSLEVNGGTITSGSRARYAIHVSGSGSAAISGGTIKTTGTSAVYMEGSNTSLTVSGAASISGNKAIHAKNAGSVRIEGGTMKGIDNGCGVIIGDVGTVSLSGGTFQGPQTGSTGIKTESGSRTVRSLLKQYDANTGEHWVYKKDGAVVTEGLDGQQLAGPVTVEKCDVAVAAPDEDSSTHSVACGGCHQTFAERQPHAPNGESSVCVCGAVLAAQVEKGGGATYYDAVEDAWAAAQSGSSTVTLLTSVTASMPLEAGSGADITLKMNDGVTFTNNSEDCFQVTGGKLTLASGTVVEGKSGKSVVYAGSGTLCVTGGTYQSSGNGFWIDSGVEVAFSGGTIFTPASGTALRYAGHAVKDMLASDCTLVTGDENQAASGLEKDTLAGGTYRVIFCRHSNLTLQGACTGICPDCGLKVVSKPHQWSSTGLCENCKAQATAKVEIGGTTTYHETIEAAWAAAKGNSATVTLLADASASQVLEMSSGDITLDCGGHTLSGTGNYTIQMTGGGLTVKNGTVQNANGTVIKGEGVYTLKIEKDAVLKVSERFHHGIYMGADRSQKGGTVKIYGTIEGADSCTGVECYRGTLEVYEGANISSNGSGLYIRGGGSVKLYGGTFSSDEGRPIYNINGISGMLGHTEDTRYAYYKAGDAAPVTEGLNINVTVSLSEATKLPSGTYTVKPCTHILDGTTCPACGAALIQVTIGGADTYYGDIQNAWNAVQGKTATLKLPKSVETAQALTLTDNSSVTLEMADGVMLTGSSENALIRVDGGTLTLASGTVENTNADSGVGLQTFGGTLEITGGTVKGNTAVLVTTGTVKVSGGTITGTGSNGAGLRKSETWDSTVQISGGTFSGTSNSVLNAREGETVADLLAEGYAFKSNGSWADTSGDSLTGTVTVEKTPVEITAQPQDATITYGESAELSVTAEAANIENAITYQWYQVGENSNTEVTGATAASYTASGLGAGTYSFYCAVTCDSYMVKSETVTVTVEKKTVTPSIMGTASKTYDGNAEVASGQLTITLISILDGDTVTATASYAYDNENAGENKTITASGIALNGDDAENYQLTSDTTTTTGTVTKADQAAPDAPTAAEANIKDTSVTLDTIENAEYSKDGTDWQESPEFTDLSPNTLYTFYARVKEDRNHNASPGSAAADIRTRKISLDDAAVTVNGSYTYTGTALIPAAGSVTVKLDGKTVDLGVYTTAVTDNTNAGTATLTVTAAEDSDYTGSASGTFMVGKAAPIVTWADATQELDYTGQAAVVTAPAVTLVNGETYQGTFNYSYAVGGAGSDTDGLPVDAGTYTIRASIPEQGNYTAAESTNTLTLTIRKVEQPAPTMSPAETLPPEETMMPEETSKPVVGPTLPPEETSKPVVGPTMPPAETLPPEETMMPEETSKPVVGPTLPPEETSKPVVGPTMPPAETIKPTETIPPEETSKPVVGPTLPPTETIKPEETSKPFVGPTLPPTETIPPEETSKPVMPDDADDDTGYDADGDSAGILTSKLKVTQTGKKLNIRWGKVTRADGYDVYVQYNGRKFTEKNAIHINSGAATSATAAKIDGKALDIKKIFKVYVLAYCTADGKKVTLGKSITVYAAGKNNSKYTNVKAVKAKKKSFRLKKGKTATVKSAVTLENKNRKLLSGIGIRKLSYTSTSKKVASVSANGKIRAKGKGTCYIYIRAANGCTGTVKVTVR